MENCKDCHNCAFDLMCRNIGDWVGIRTPCSAYKDRSRFVELPCKIGDTVYSIYKGDIEAHIVNRLEFCTVGNNSECQDYFGTAEGIDDCDENFSFINFTKATFGKTVFLTREAAEQALKERENNAN